MQYFGKHAIGMMSYILGIINIDVHSTMLISMEGEKKASHLYGIVPQGARTPARADGVLKMPVHELQWVDGVDVW